MKVFLHVTNGLINDNYDLRDHAHPPPRSLPSLRSHLHTLYQRHDQVGIQKRRTFKLHIQFVRSLLRGIILVFHHHFPPSHLCGSQQATIKRFIQGLLIDFFANEDNFLPSITPQTGEVSLNRLDDVSILRPITCVGVRRPSTNAKSGDGDSLRGTVQNQGPPSWSVSMPPA
jgi:hypothetical protein